MGHSVVRRRHCGVAKGVFARGTLLTLEALEADLVVAEQPKVELPARNAEEPACSADVLGDLLVMLDSPESDLRPPQLLVFPFDVSNADPPRP